ncbi:MAG TPA: SDR family NAD(P)-dependent oxidoreductase [Desulfosporosinus sp.]|nr:SDR family NAD(P)-dependent oxidoreductase [Desulfosporosinus sp.]
MRLAEKVAIITGGSGDIGSACALKFLENGAKVVLIGTNPQKLNNALDSLSEYGEKVKGITANVKSYKDMEKAVEFTLQTFGRIDILVANAGIVRHAPIDEMTLEDWNEVVNVNFNGVFNSCKAVVPQMKKQKYGRIVNMSSIAGRTGRAGCGVNYSATKAGVVGITQQLAYELGPWNITVNAVAPGPVMGEMLRKSSEEDIRSRTAPCRIPRLGTLEEVAYAILYLASDEAGWTTGEVLDINGGLFY